MLIHSENVGGFEIKFYALPEDMNPRDCFDSGEEYREQDEDWFDKIESGYYDWFIARVTASKNGVELASDYLGGCWYESAMEFVTANDYYSDMVQTVIQEAKETIKKLTEPIDS